MHNTYTNIPGMNMIMYFNLFVELRNKMYFYYILDPNLSPIVMVGIVFVATAITATVVFVIVKHIRKHYLSQYKHVVDDEANLPIGTMFQDDVTFDLSSNHADICAETMSNAMSTTNQRNAMNDVGQCADINDKSGENDTHDDTVDDEVIDRPCVQVACPSSVVNSDSEARSEPPDKAKNEEPTHPNTSQSHESHAKSKVQKVYMYLVGHEAEPITVEVDTKEDIQVISVEDYRKEVKQVHEEVQKESK